MSQSSEFHQRNVTMKRQHFFYLGVLIVAACESAHGVHQSQLKLEYSGRSVVPSFARNLSGTPFTGRAYGTFFGEALLDSVEWEGTFTAGRPDGQFLIYKDGASPPLKVWFKDGARATAREPGPRVDTDVP